MSEACSVLTADAGRQIRLDGALTFGSAAATYAAALASFGGLPVGSVIEIDCAGVTQADSSGLAVMLDWLREATRADYSLRFANLPVFLLQLARISEVESLLKDR